MKKIMISKLCISIVGLFLLFGCATTSGTKEASAGEDIPVLTDIHIEDGNVVIKSNKSFTYTMYNPVDPYKTTIEIPDMSIGAFTSKITSDKSGITEIIPQQIDSPHLSARIDIMLQTPSIITPSYEKNTLVLSIKKEQSVVQSELKNIESEDSESQPNAVPLAAVAEPPVRVIKTVDETAQPTTKATEIQSIEINKAAGVVRVSITGNGAIIPNVFPVNERIVVDIPDVSLKASLPEKVIAPLKGIRAGKHKNKLRLVFDLREKTNFDVTATGNSIEIALLANEMPATQAPAPMAEQPPFKSSSKAASTPVKPAKPAQPAPEPATSNGCQFAGKKINLDFQDADVRPIFRLLADVSGCNLVLDPSVKGNTTIKLFEVPWEQALDIILNTLNLSKSIEGNILWIAPNSVFARMNEDKQKAKELGEKAEDLEQVIVRVNYASSSDISSAVNSGKLLTPRGSIAIDGRMNTLIVQDTQKSIDNIKELVKIMDVPKAQVMIAARIVEVDTTYSKSLGIRWGGAFNVPSFPNILGGNFSVNTPTVAAGPDTSNPGGAANFTVGNASTVMVNMSLSALEGIGKAKSLSNPRVLTMDNESATIQQGRSFFIPTVSQSGTQTQEEKATLSLTVTPKITPDGYVQLKVLATDDTLEPGTSGTDAVINTKSLNTNALVKSGETLVLGGIFTQSVTESETGVPILNKIPGLGWLFKTKEITGPDTREMLIFITPTIVTREL